ncbi:MAG: DUF234 domain-containing protein, partial [Methanocellales archaeon]|nr:DUF234 domain-containing protein [Methanocellales archaeon]
CLVAYLNAEEQGIKGNDILSALKILLFRDFAPLKDEARSILIEEFGRSFEEISKQLLVELNSRNALAFKNGDKRVAFFEVKWNSLSKREALKILTELREKSKFVDLSWKKEYFGLIAKKTERAWIFGL